MRTQLLLEMAAGSEPDRLAIGPKGSGWSYKTLQSHALVLANWLIEETETSVAFLGLNDALFPALLFASGRAGKPITPLNYRLPDEDLRVLLARTAPVTAFVDDDMIARVKDLEGVNIVAKSRVRALLDAGGAALAENDDPEDEHAIALTLFTSGTTGAAKAALLRHQHLTSYVISTIEFMEAGADEAALVSVPPYHIAGVSAILTNLYRGRRIVYMDKFEPDTWVETAHAETITHAMLVPTMLGRILDEIERTGRKLPALRAISYGGGRMPQSVIARALKLLPHVDFVNAYGLTETSSTISVLSPDDHRLAIASDDPDLQQRLGSVGRPLPMLEVQIRAPDGAVLAVGQVGEIFVRGDQVAGEYEEGTALQSDGWFPTKDAGWLDAHGFLYVDGRLDDVIVRGGENISPGEIEDVIRGHDGVEDVAVIGVPNADWGESIAAIVVPKDPDLNADSLAPFVRARLRSTKTPDEWRFRSELPYNETGKLLRRVLKLEHSS